MLNKLLRVLGVTEVVLLVVAIILYFATAGANDFSGLVVLYPIYAMFGVGVLALVLFIAGLGTHKPAGQPRRKSTTHKLLILAAFSVPILYVVNGFTAGYGNNLSVLALLYICVLATFIVINQRNLSVDMILYTFLLLLPVLMVYYSSNMNDSNIYTQSKIIAAMLIAPTLINVIVRLTHSSSPK